MSVKYRILAALVTSLLISMGMSFIMALLNFGIADGFLGVWFKGWGIGFIVSMPLSYLLPPIVQRFLNKRGIE